MIQELLGGVVEERKISIPGSLLIDPSSSSTSISTTSQLPSASSSPSTTSEPQQNLRCPRCDSSNTKFCYYNNYNLTQPRHFCKTCRRYWTKGGALRNVPIGGGCRKAKAAPGIAAVGGKSGATKAKPPSSDFLARSCIGGGEHELPSSPIFWASPHTSHLMALLRATSVQNPNPNTHSIPSLNSVRIKDDDAAMIAANTAADTVGPLHSQGLSLDPLVGQLPMAPCGSLWRNSNQYAYQQQQQQPQQLQQHGSMLLGEVPSSGIQELYQKFKTSTNYCNDQLHAVMSNVCCLDSSTSSSSSSSSSATAAAAAAAATTMTTTMGISTATSILEPIPLSGGEFSYWNPALTWSDLPTTNGAFP